jgi:hypothetical protein
MQTIKAGEGQTLIDIAMQYCGDADKVAMQLSELNSISLTADLQPGDAIIIPAVLIENKKNVEEFASKELEPASNDDNEVKPEGIGYWKINLDFKVS